MAYASELKRQETGQWWTSKDTFGTVLAALFIDTYGLQAVEWDPETIRLQLKHDLSIEIPQVNADKLLAIITTMTTNLFNTSVESFTVITNALNNSAVDFNNWSPPSAEECAWALTEVTLNNPPAKREKFADQFSSDIRRYIGVILEQEGIQTPPDILRIAELDEQGIRNADETFADDPEMFSGFSRLSQEKAEDITDYVRGRLHILISQLQKAPLVNRDQHTWQKFLNKSNS